VSRAAPLFHIEGLAGGHDRSAFTCGVPVLDRYFREQVTQDVRRRVGNCFAAVEQTTGIIAGFYTLAATSLLLASIPDDQTRRLPRYPSVPAALLARLAVATSFQGRKLGGILLADAIDRVARGDLGAFALVVDAKDANARRFYEHHGFAAIKDDPMRLLLPIATALKAGLGTPVRK
jgi:GNAT superfamily N-acetyltransferase